MIYLKKFSGVWHSAVLRTLPLSGSLNRRICGSLSLAQISQSETSHIPNLLGDMPNKNKEEIENV